MIRKLLCVFSVCAAATAVSPSAEAGTKKSFLPPLPYETYFAKYRADRAVLKFNDFSGKINAKRIKKLLRSGRVLGDRVLLDNNLAVYFPEGYIVSSTMRLDQFRPKKGLTAKKITSTKDIEVNPDYALVNLMDEHLGEVCAEITTSDQVKASVRKNRDGILSLVKQTSGRFDYLVGEQSEAFEITSALKPSYLSSNHEIQRAVSKCI